MAASRYRIPLDQFERDTPRVHAHPVDPGDPDGEMSPGTAFAMVEQPEPVPNGMTVEGMIAGIGRVGTAVGSGSVNHRAQVSLRLILLIIALPFVIALAVVLFH